MTLSTNYPLAYGLARLQARVSYLPTEAEWVALHAIEGYAPFLDAARKGPLVKWLSNLDTYSGIHEIERKLRHSFSWHIEELTHWLPRRWHPCLRWLGLLPYLEIFAYLERDGRERRWMREDMFLFQYLMPTPSLLQPPRKRQAFEALPDTWIDGWYQRLPEGVWQDQRDRIKFAHALLSTVGLVNSAEISDSWQVRKQQMALLQKLFHRHYTSPVAAFAYLGLILVEIGWLRAELQSHLLFPARRMAS